MKLSGRSVFSLVLPVALGSYGVTAVHANPVVWSLEGNSPNSLTWDGWSSKTLRPGDKLRVTIEPLRNGSPGGTWTPRKVSHVDGTPIVTAHW